MSKKNEAAVGALRRPVTMREAAKLLGVSFKKLEAMRDGYRLLTIRVGRRRLVPVSELKKHLN
jgi:excisionase family DNA binding protein